MSPSFVLESSVLAPGKHPPAPVASFRASVLCYPSSGSAPLPSASQCPAPGVETQAEVSTRPRFHWKGRPVSPTTHHPRKDAQGTHTPGTNTTGAQGAALPPTPSLVPRIHPRPWSCVLSPLTWWCAGGRGSLYSLLAHHGDVDTVGCGHGGKGHPAAHQGWSSLGQHVHAHSRGHCGGCSCKVGKGHLPDGCGASSIPVGVVD